MSCGPLLGAAIPARLTPNSSLIMHFVTIFMGKVFFGGLGSTPYTACSVVTYAHVCRGILIPWNCNWHQKTVASTGEDCDNIPMQCAVIKLTASLKHTGLKNVCCTLFLRMQRSYHRWAAHNTLCPNDAALLSDGETHLEAPTLLKKTYCPTSAGSRENPIIPVFPLHLRRLSRSVLSGLFCLLLHLRLFHCVICLFLDVSVCSRGAVYLRLHSLLRKKDGGGQ